MKKKLQAAVQSLNCVGLWSAASGSAPGFIPWGCHRASALSRLVSSFEWCLFKISVEPNCFSPNCWISIGDTHLKLLIKWKVENEEATAPYQQSSEEKNQQRSNSLWSLWVLCSKKIFQECKDVGADANHFWLISISEAYLKILAAYFIWNLCTNRQQPWLTWARFGTLKMEIF